MPNEDSKLMAVAEFVGVRIIYFIGSYIALIVFFGRGLAVHFARVEGDEFSIYSRIGTWGVFGIVSLIVAFFGPWIYEHEVKRGRGTLRKVKDGTIGDDE